MILKGVAVHGNEQPAVRNEVTASTVGTSLQAHTINGDVYLAPAPAVLSDPAPPGGWDELPDLPPELAFLLRAQVRSGLELPYRLPGARRPSLDTVHVRQELGGVGVEHEHTDKHGPIPVLDSRGQVTVQQTAPRVRLTVRPPTKTLREALDGDDHVVVTGGPGQGKSTLSLRLAADIAARWLGEADGEAPLDEPVLPLRLTARELAARMRSPFQQALIDSAFADYGALLGPRPDERLLAGRALGCRWLLLVDGLDEVASAVDRDRLVSVLASWASGPDSPYRVVLTTRPIGGTALAPLQQLGASRYELQPFDEAALFRFAANWFGGDGDAQRFLHQIRAAHLDELVRVPLLATIAAIVYEQHGDRPLPDNQYELYESYLRYIRGTRDQDPRDRVREPLLEHLGCARLEEDTSLAAAARSWVRDNAPELTGDPVDHLAAVGPFLRRGDDLRFLHHSFAEHLAATAKARLLPDRFDPSAPELAALLHAARPDHQGRFARAVLLHYTRLHPSQADGLLDALHAGTAEHHLLAARLLAAHVPASTATVEAFLGTARAWAQSSTGFSADILAQTSRATHHPGMPDWLRALMRDPDYPWRSRIEAAIALASRVRGPDTDEALTLLRSVVTDPEIDVTDRLVAAEALSEHSGDRQAAEAGLRSVLDTPTASAVDRRKAAVVLAGFGGAARAHAVRAMEERLADEWAQDEELAEAATGLLEIGVEFHEQCADVFRAVLGRQRFGPGSRESVLGLASIGNQHADEAASVLVRWSADRRVDHYTRVVAAEVLLKLGPRHRAEGMNLLSTIAREPDVKPFDLWRLASVLADAGAPERAPVLLRQALADPEALPNHLLWAAKTLAELGPDHVDEAVANLTEVVEHPATSDHDRAAAWEALAGLGEPHQTHAVQALRAAVTDRCADPEARCAAASALAGMDPEYVGEVAAALLPIVAGAAPMSVRLEAWSALQRLGPRIASQATAEFQEIAPAELARSLLHVTTRARKLYDLLGCRDEVMSAWLSLMNHPDSSSNERLMAVRALVDPRLNLHPHVVADVAIVIGNGWFSDRHLFRLSVALGHASALFRSRVMSSLISLLGRPSATAFTVCAVAKAARELGNSTNPSVMSALEALIADDRAEWRQRQTAALALATMLPDMAARLAQAVLRGPRTWPKRWQYDIQVFVNLGWTWSRRCCSGSPIRTCGAKYGSRQPPWWLTSLRIAKANSAPCSSR